MNKKTNLFLLVFLLIIFTSFVSAQQDLGTFKQYSPINLIQSCQNSTYANISSIVLPNSTFYLSSETPMTLITPNNYQYSLLNTDSIGQYLVYGHCDENGINTIWAYSFSINQTGQSSTLSQGLIYIFLTIISMLFCYGFYFFAINLDTNDVFDRLGYLSKLNYKKSLRLFLFGISYLFLIWFVWLCYQLSYGFLPVEIGITGILYTIWLGMFYTLAPILIIWFITLIVSTIRAIVINARIAKGYKNKMNKKSNQQTPVRINEDFAGELQEMKGMSEAKLRREVSLNELTKVIPQHPLWNPFKKKFLEELTEFKNDKRGSGWDYIILSIMAVFVALFFIFWSFGFHLAYTNLMQITNPPSINGSGIINITGAFQQTFGAVDNSYLSLRWLGVLMILVSFLSILISNAFVSDYPIAFLAYVCFGILSVVVGVQISTAYQLAINSPMIASYASTWIGYNYILLNLPTILTIMSFFGAITLFVNLIITKNNNPQA